VEQKQCSLGGGRKKTEFREEEKRRQKGKRGGGKVYLARMAASHYTVKGHFIKDVQKNNWKRIHPEGLKSGRYGLEKKD